MFSRLTRFAKSFWKETPATTIAADSAPKTDTAPKTAPIPSTEPAPTVNPLAALMNRSGAQGDLLKKAQDNLVGLRVKFAQDVTIWEDLRDTLIMQDKHAEHAYVDLRASYTHSRLGLIQRIKEILIGLIESPDVYLRDHLKPITLRVRELSIQFDKLVAANESGQSPESKHEEKIEICKTSISIMECFNEMIKTTLGEIDYCLSIGRVGEKLLQGAVTYAICNVPFGALDVVKLNLEPLYRDQIYKRIHDEVDNLCEFMIQIGGAVNAGKPICASVTPAPVSRSHSIRASSFFVLSPEIPSVVASPVAEYKSATSAA